MNKFAAIERAKKKAVKDFLKNLEKLKSGKNINDFIAYCTLHPGERFWQALRNWSGYSMIYGVHAEENVSRPIPDYPELHDTFYDE